MKLIALNISPIHPYLLFERAAKKDFTRIAIKCGVSFRIMMSKKQISKSRLASRAKFRRDLS